MDLYPEITEYSILSNNSCKKILKRISRQENMYEINKIFEDFDNENKNQYNKNKNNYIFNIYKYILILLNCNKL